MVGMAALCLFENGPIIGNARGEEVVVVWLLAALPLALEPIAGRGRGPVTRASPAAA